MITRQEAIRRLEDVEQEIAGLKKALQEEWDEMPSIDPTQAFLEKCGGWEDTRNPEEIIAHIYAARTTSNRGADIFDERPQ